MLDPLIFDTPSSRSVNVMGTSATVNPSVIVRQVETPRLGPDELKAHIAYEADKYIPFGTEEVIIDAQPLPKGMYLSAS